MYIKRLLAKRLIEAKDKFPAILITGPRQSGKTTFVQQELQNTHTYVSFDDPLNRAFAINDPKGFLLQFKDQSLILDEIQYVPEILSYIKIDIDQKHQAGKWILTGSQQFQFMKNVTETLAGRIAILELLPFSFKEAEYNYPDKLKDAIWNGGYPDPCLYPAKRDLWLNGYLQTYIERDVRSLENIRDLRTFETFVNLCAAFHSNPFNTASLARDCGISLPTVKEWGNLLHASYVLLFLPPYFQNFGKRLIKTPKMYFFDSALVSFLTRQQSPEASLAGSMGDALFEGLIVSETYKAFYNKGIQPHVYFWRSHDGLEIDMLIHTQGKIYPVEIKLTATPTHNHIIPLNRFKKLLAGDSSETGIIVCRVEKKQALPGNNLALPWFTFSDYLDEIIS
ncbi:ATP-binding protein [bacterium]|nr:ATP-binding protein [bacterium]